MILSLKCHNCGATVYFDNNDIITRCSHCGAHLKEMTEYTLKAADLNIKQQSANIDVGREQGITEARSKEMRSRAKSMVFAMVGCFGTIILFVLLIKYILLKH